MCGGEGVGGGLKGGLGRKLWRCRRFQGEGRGKCECMCCAVLSWVCAVHLGLP